MNRNLSINDLTQQNVEAISQMEKAANASRTFGEWVADLVAVTVGSWPFIIIQSLLLGVWMVLNLAGWFYHWDPYPFILLNLALSFQAAYASPIIMISQNRQAKLSERRNKLDLQINLLAEQETTEMLRRLRLLCEKLHIDVDKDAPGNTLEQATCADEVIRQIDQAAAEKQSTKAC